LVDADESNYSENTLRQWKELAERRAYEALEQGAVASTLAEPDTLVAIGWKIVVKAVWVGGGDKVWKFRCTSFYRGDRILLRDEISKGGIDFIVVESQGDGRKTSGPIQWHDNNGHLELLIPVADRAPRLDPRTLGKDLALSKSGDLVLENGDLATVSGTESAIQTIGLAMGTMVSERVMRPALGSLRSLYFHNYGADSRTLARLFKLELARLATIPAGQDPPPLNSIWRVDSVAIPSLNLVDRRLSISVDLEWSNGERWSGEIAVYIHADLKSLPPWVGV
jgi:hypothetical protein